MLFLKNTEAATGGAEAVTRAMLQKNVLLKISRTSQENTCNVVFLIKLQVFSLQVFWKETPTQVLSCEVCKMFKNNYFEKHLQMTASGGVLSCS